MSGEPQVSPPTDISEDLLPFVVELWTDDGEKETVFARVQIASLGAVAFNACRTDLPARRVILHGVKVIADTVPADSIAQQS